MRILMSFDTLFAEPAHQAEKEDLPLLRSLTDRYATEHPFDGQTVVFGHLLVRNALPMVEALWRGGAQPVLCDAHPSPATGPVMADLRKHRIRVLSLDQAVRAGDLFLDVGAVLGRRRTPRAAAEVTRTGVLHYRRIACPMVSADDCRAKHIEGFFGTGDGFVRAWQQLRPKDPLEGKRVVQFGFGKIGRGLAHRTRAAGMLVTIVEVDPTVQAQAEQEGFDAIDAHAGRELQRALAAADVVVAVTGIPSVLGHTVPPDWIRANRPTLVNLGAEDEFGPAFDERQILGGRAVPLNFHLAQPTLNRYVDPALAAHLLALEALVRRPEAFPSGIHPLPREMDDWVIRTWRKAWPDEDLTGIAQALGVE
jgi:adenosylhomocysteinase